MITAERYHDISCGHRVVGHEGKCALLHGHNYRIHFTIEGELDDVGRVLDFGMIKHYLCQWLEEHWDHFFLAWDQDASLKKVAGIPLLAESIVWVPFNPTAENIAAHLLTKVGPRLLHDSGAQLIRVRVEETRKCSATASS